MCLFKVKSNHRVKQFCKYWRRNVVPNLCPVTVTNNTHRGVGVRAWQTRGEWHAEEEREKHTKGRGSTYRGGSVEPRAAIGDRRTFPSRRPPVTQQWQEEFRVGATVVVWLHGKMGGGRRQGRWGDEAKGEEVEAWKEKEKETSRREKIQPQLPSNLTDHSKTLEVL